MGSFLLIWFLVLMAVVIDQQIGQLYELMRAIKRGDVDPGGETGAGGGDGKL